MKIWDRINCRWVKWHGTKAAWLKLPHAVIAGTCTISLGALAVYHLHVQPIPPVLPVSTAVYTVGMGYLNPYRSFEVVPYNVLVPGDRLITPVKCNAHYDHDSDDCKQPKRTVPEPSPFWLMLAGTGLLLDRWRRSRG